MLPTHAPLLGFLEERDRQIQLPLLFRSSLACLCFETVLDDAGLERTPCVGIVEPFCDVWVCLGNLFLVHKELVPFLLVSLCCVFWF